MTANEFITEIIKEGIQYNISGKTISEQVNLTSDLIATGVIIENCIFEESVFMEGIDLSYGIKFIKCEFKKALSFNNCLANKYDLTFNFDGYHLDFNDTKVKYLSFGGTRQIERGVRIDNNSIINNLQVQALFSNKGSLTIIDSTIETLFDIRQANIKGDVSIRNNCTINAKIRFENVIAGSIVFTESNFKKDIHIWAGKIGSLTFNDGVFGDDLSINAVPISSYLTIIGTDFKKSINFNLWDETNTKTGKLNKVHIQSGKFGEQLTINGNNGIIEELTIDSSKQLEGDLYFNSCDFISTKLSGDNYNSNIVFSHSNFNELSFDFFNNYSTLSIISAKSFDNDSRLTIAHTNLGKTHFFNTFLDSFEKVNIYNSVMTEIIIANVKWFNDERLNQSISILTQNFTQKKEIYRQIKFALEKQGDRITSLRFKALEMRAYKNELFSGIKWHKRIFNIDRFILWVGQTNNFGLNWLKPIIIALGFTLFFYFLIVVGISDKLAYIPNFSTESLNLTWTEFVKFGYAIPQLMNPAHLLSRVFPAESNLNFLVHTWDYLLKIVLAFFIFQIVSAFRKYMK